MGCISSPYPEQEYYSKETGGVGIAYGVGAERLGIAQGSLVKDDIVQNLRDGKSPDGKQNLAYNAGRENRRDAYDIHLAPPKSVSIAAELLPEAVASKVMAAHQAGVAAAMQRIEQNYTYYRQTENRVTSLVKSDNLIGFQYTHLTSRELDPQIGTHNLTMNMTVAADGSIKALENRPILRAQKEIKAVYDAAVASALIENNIKIEITKNGSFEIAGISQEAISLFSKRAAKIEKKIEELKQDTSLSKDAVYQTAKLSTRPDKDLSKNINELKANWEQQLAAANINILESFNLAQKDFIKKDINKEAVAEQIVKSAIADLTKNEAVIKKTDLNAYALKLGIGKVTIDDIDKALDNNALDIVKIPGQGGQEYVTTNEMIDLEMQVIKNYKSGIGKVSAIQNDVEKIYDKIKTTEALKTAEIGNSFNFTAEQASAIKNIATSGDVFTNIQGVAGAGKTTMLQVIKDLAQESGFKVEMTSFQGKAADEMAKAMKDKSVTASTLDSFINKEITDNTLIVVDEFSMSDLYHVKALQDKIKNLNNVHVVQIGGKEQIQAVGAGKVFEQSQSFINTSILKTSNRQKDKDYKDVVKSFEKMDIDEAFDKMQADGKILEIKEPVLKTDYVVKSFFDKKSGGDVLIVTDTNVKKNEYNKQIHNISVEKNLIKNETTITIKQNKYLKSAEMRNASNYSAGDFIYLKSGSSQLGRAGAEFTVSQIDKDANKLTISKVSKDGIRTNYDLDLNDTDLLDKIGGIYELSSIKIGIGEQVKFTKNDKKYRVNNGQVGIIENIRNADGNTYIDIKSNNEMRTIKTIEYNYIDFSYASTVNGSQGMTVSAVIGDLDSNQGNFNKSYVTVSRGVNDYEIVTDDIATLKENSKEMQEKSSILDHSDLEQLENSYLTVEDVENSIEMFEQDDITAKHTSNYKSYASTKGDNDYEILTNDITALNNINIDIDYKSDKSVSENITKPVRSSLEDHWLGGNSRTDIQEIDKDIDIENTELKNNIKGISENTKRSERSTLEDHWLGGSGKAGDDIKDLNEKEPSSSAEYEFKEQHKEYIKNKYQDKNMKDIADVVDNFIDDISGKYAYSNYMGKSNVFDKAMGGIEKIIDDRVQGKKPAKNQDKINFDRDIKEVGTNILSDIAGQYGDIYNEHSNNIFEEALNELAGKLEKKIEKAVKNAVEKIENAIENGLKDIADDISEIAETIETMIEL